MKSNLQLTKLTVKNLQSQEIQKIKKIKGGQPPIDQRVPAEQLFHKDVPVPLSVPSVGRPTTNVSSLDAMSFLGASSYSLGPAGLFN